MVVRSARSAVLAAAVLSTMACAATAKKPLVDPFPLRFPLVEAGTLEIDGRVVGQPWARDGIAHFATDDGFVTAAVVPSRSVLWRRSRQEVAGSLSDRPVQEGPKPLTFRTDGNLLQALDAGNTLVWEFAADAPIAAEPTVASGRVFFGTENRRFYCLKAATGKVKGRRRLQGAPLHAPVVRGGVVAVPVANSVVYFLSRRGGSILSWQAVPSRIIYPLAVAGPTLLVSSASPDVLGIDIATGRTVGRHSASGLLAAGAVWSPPYVVLFIEDPETGRQRLVFLRSR
jgi:outer membrane protein assembly factor BamB